MPICLVVLIGIPASGKSTFSREVIIKCQTKNYKFHIIAYDDLKNGQQTYKELRNLAFATVEKTIETIINSAADCETHLIILDDNMYYKSMRYQFYRLAQKCNVSFVQLFIEVELSVALSRNRQRHEPVPETIIKDMAEKLEKPGRELWEQNSLTIKSGFDQNSYAIFFETLAISVAKPLQNKKETERVTTPVTKLQQIDLMLRKILHKKITETKSESQKYVWVKKDLYQRIKNNEITVENTCTKEELFSFLERLFRKNCN